MAAAPSIVCCSTLRDGMRILLLADARLTMYGACTITGMDDARSASASSRGTGFFQPCGSERKIWTTSDPVASAIASGSSIFRWAPIFIVDFALAMRRGYGRAVIPSAGCGIGSGPRIEAPVEQGPAAAVEQRQVIRHERHPARRAHRHRP